MDTKYNILLVDDDTFLLDMYSVKFRERGLGVETADGGEAALKKLRDGLKPDVILLDLIMPGVDGFELLETINKEKLAEGALLIVLSNQGQDVEIERAKQLGVVGYIVKASAIPSEVLSQILTIIKDHNK